MLPNVFELTYETIRTWVKQNAAKIQTVSNQGPWEGWAQVELAYAIGNALDNAASQHGPDTLIIHQREVPIWLNNGHDEDKNRVDLLVNFENVHPTSPYSAIELKALSGSPEAFFSLALSDAQKFQTSHLQPKWYAHSGCHVWAGGFVVLKDSRQYHVPADFAHYTVPVPGAGADHIILVAFWLKTIDYQGYLGPFDLNYEAPQGEPGEEGAPHGIHPVHGGSNHPSQGVPHSMHSHEQQHNLAAHPSEEHEDPYDMHSMQTHLPHLSGAEEGEEDDEGAHGMHLPYHGTEEEEEEGPEFMY